MKTWLLAAIVAVNPCLRSENGGTQIAGSFPIDAPTATVQFNFERPVARASYKFVLREDGAGTYTATYPATPPATPQETVDVPLLLHRALAARIFEQARTTIPLHGNCETKVKNIAQTGTKTLAYADPAGSKATCAWNYSDKSAVAGLQEEFIAMAVTLDTGRRLKMQQRFDRLGMDREIAFLLEQAKSGQALGLENIAPVLEEIVADTSLLERVRARAKILLDMSRLER